MAALPQWSQGQEMHNPAFPDQVRYFHKGQALSLQDYTRINGAPPPGVTGPISGVGAQGTQGLRGDAPGLPYLQTPVAGKDTSEAAYYRDMRQKQLDPGYNTATQTLATDRRLEGLLSKQKTGGMYALPVVGDALAMFDPEAREIKALSSQKARLQRQPGEGTISDFDARMFQTMVPGLSQPLATNKALILAERIGASNGQDRRAFADWYHDRFNTTSGMNEAWRTYAESNPIFDPRSEQTGRPMLNDKRQNWRQYFGAERGGLDAQPTQVLKDIKESQRSEVPDAARNAYAKYSKEKGIDRSAKPGSAKNPFLARDDAEMAKAPPGSYVISPTGQFGYVR